MDDSYLPWFNFFRNDFELLESHLYYDSNRAAHDFCWDNVSYELFDNLYSEQSTQCTCAIGRNTKPISFMLFGYFFGNTIRVHVQ